ncbi:hypothetical protein FGB62_30g228 [Gracilaria domingensis]|nr:hypothetical protein FGB62_30g228 [Gracilaria domingensis]
MTRARARCRARSAPRAEPLHGMCAGARATATAGAREAARALVAVSRNGAQPRAPSGRYFGIFAHAPRLPGAVARSDYTARARWRSLFLASRCSADRAREPEPPEHHQGLKCLIIIVPNFINGRRRRPAAPAGHGPSSSLVPDLQAAPDQASARIHPLHSPNQTQTLAFRHSSRRTQLALPSSINSRVSISRSLPASSLPASSLPLSSASQENNSKPHSNGGFRLTILYILTSEAEIESIAEITTLI